MALGSDNIDLQAAAKRDFLFCSSIVGMEFADHTLAFMLTAARKIIPINAGVHAGGWTFMQHQPIYNSSKNRTNQFGYIAQKVASRAKSFWDGNSSLIHGWQRIKRQL